MMVRYGVPMYVRSTLHVYILYGVPMYVRNTLHVYICKTTVLQIYVLNSLQADLSIASKSSLLYQALDCIYWKLNHCTVIKSVYTVDHKIIPDFNNKW